MCVCVCVPACVQVLPVSSHNSITLYITTPSRSTTGTTGTKPEPTHCCPQLYGAHVKDVPTKSRSHVKLGANVRYFSRSCSVECWLASPPTECPAYKEMLPANSSADTLPLPFVQTDTTHLYVAAHTHTHTHTLMWTHMPACAHTHTHTYIHTYIHMHMHARTHAHTWKFLPLCTISTYVPCRSSL